MTCPILLVNGPFRQPETHSFSIGRYFLFMQRVDELLVEFGSLTPDETESVSQSWPTALLHVAVMVTWTLAPLAIVDHLQFTTWPVPIVQLPPPVALAFVGTW